MKPQHGGRLDNVKLAQAQPTQDTSHVDVSNVHSARVKKTRPEGIIIPPRFPCRSEDYTPVRSGRPFASGTSPGPSTFKHNVAISSVRDDQPRLTLDNILDGSAPRPATPHMAFPKYMSFARRTGEKPGYSPTSDTVHFPCARFCLSDQWSAGQLADCSHV